MRKLIPIDLNKYPSDTWIDLPQGTHIHPKEVEKMFDDKEMSEEGREYGAEIFPSGKIRKEKYGNNSSVRVSKSISYEDAKDTIFTHSHPRFLLKEELDEGIISAPPLTYNDLRNPYKETRAFSQNKDISSGQLHTFKINDDNSYEDVADRNKMGGFLLHEIKEIEMKSKDSPKYQAAMKTVKGFPISNNMYTAAEFNLAKLGAGDAAVINVKKSEDPNKIYITKIRSTYKDKPSYDLLSTLPRKKKLTKPTINRLDFNLNLNSAIKKSSKGLVNFNLSGLNNLLVNKKKKSIKRK